MLNICNWASSLDAKHILQMFGVFGVLCVLVVWCLVFWCFGVLVFGVFDVLVCLCVFACLCVGSLVGSFISLIVAWLIG